MENLSKKFSRAHAVYQNTASERRERLRPTETANDRLISRKKLQLSFVFLIPK